MATRGRRESSYVAISSLLLPGVFLLLWGSRMVSAHESAMEEAKEKADSWANWVQDKVTEGLGLRNGNAKMAAEHVKHSVGDAADEIPKASFDASNDKIMRTEEIKDALRKHFDDYKLNAIPNTKGVNLDHLQEPKINAELKAETAGEKIKDGANKVAGEAEKAFEGVKEKVKETFQAAKEKASPTTGDLGAEVKKKLAGEL